MAFDLDNEELKATRKLHNQDDGLYEETSDKNVANIEDDVKIVKRYLENSAYKESNSDFFKNGGWEIVDLEIPKAMKNIIAEREQDKKRIQELEEERQIVGMPVKNKRDGRIGIVLHQWKSGNIAVLENINPRVINTHESWNTLEIITDEVKQAQTNSNSIPKQKIKEALEDIEDYFERLNGPDKDIEYIRQVKQELLEKEENRNE